MFGSPLFLFLIQLSHITSPRCSAERRCSQPAGLRTGAGGMEGSGRGVSVGAGEQVMYTCDMEAAGPFRCADAVRAGRVPPKKSAP